jgi:histidinol-phosphate aminotransferase
MTMVSRARSEVQAMKAYFSARNSLPADREWVFLDASELPCEPLPGTQGYARYGAQQPPALIAALARLYGVGKTHVMAARGADEAIDILIRTFCEPGKDNVIINPPTFPMYAQFSRLHGASIKNIDLREDFSPDADKILAAVDENTKLVFVCSPNNPTGNTVDRAIVQRLCTALAGRALVIVDEAYIDFCPEETCQGFLSTFDNMVILRTLSKAYALAGVRCGCLIARPEIVELCTRVLAAYPMPVPAVDVVLKTLEPANVQRLNAQRTEVLKTRDTFIKDLAAVPGVEKVFATKSNFVLVRVTDASKVMTVSHGNGYILRDMSAQPRLKNCLRISMGTPEQMAGLVRLLREGKS